MSSDSPSQSSAPGPSASVQPTHSCPWCSFASRSPSGLKTHITRKHKEVGPPAAGIAADLSSLSSPQSTLAASGPSGPVSPYATDSRAPLGSPQPPMQPHASPSLATLKQSLRVLPRVPQAARLVAARKFIRLLDDVASHNNLPSWTHLLEFAYRVLHVPPAAKAKPLYVCVKGNVESYDRELSLPRTQRSRPRPDLSDSKRAQAAEQRLASRADLKGAVRLLASSESLVSPNDPHATEEMIAKHPSPLEDDLAPELPATTPPRNVSVDEVLSSLRTFPVGSAGGLDGITAQHILDLLSVGGEVRRILLSSLGRVCDIMAKGRVPEEARDLVFGSWLIAAAKPSLLDAL